MIWSNVRLNVKLIVRLNIWSKGISRCKLWLVVSESEL